jgi:glutamate carboxypeptidase
MTTTSAAVPSSILDRSVEVLRELCSISSASGDTEGLYRMTEALGRELTPLGLLPEVHAESGLNGSAQPVFIARGSGIGENRTLLLGHLDTVLPAIPPRMEGSRLMGTGALDMKGGFAALVGALQLLRKKGERPPDDLMLVGVPDEEVGGPVSIEAVRRWGGSAHTVLVLEPGAPSDGGETLVTGRRGLTVWRLDARGRAAHSGVAYWDGRSALAAAANWAATVQRMSEIGDGPVVNVGRIVGGDSEFVSDVGEEHRFIGTSERLNIVADRCLVEGEVRYLHPEDDRRVLTAMRDLASSIGGEWGVEMSFDEVEDIPAMLPSDSGNQLAEYLVQAAERNGWRLELEPNRGGVSFPNLLPDPSSLSVIDGLGPVGGGMHTREEYVSLESLERRIGLIAEALIYVREQRSTLDV